MTLEPMETRMLLSVGLIGVPDWIPEGPAPITDGGGNVVMADPLKSGSDTQIAIDPLDAKHVFVAAVNGGVWETNDFTVANPVWSTTTDKMPSLAIASIALSPSNSNVVYAGTGSYSSIFSVDGSGNDINGKGGRAVGIYKSTDGGTTWQIENPGGIFSGLRINRIIATTLNGGQTVFASTTDGGGAGGVFRSDDGGTNWTRLSGANGLPNTSVTDLVQNPVNANQFFAATSNTLAGASAGVYRLDLGVSPTNWVNVTNDMVAGDLTNSLRIELSVSAAGANPVWASIINPSGFYQRVYRGVTSGATITWTQVGPSGQPPDVLAGTQGAVHGSIEADPASDTLVYIGGDRIPSGSARTSGYIARGDSAANTWTGITPVGTAPAAGTNTVIPTSNGVTTSPHADTRDMVFAAGGVLLLACDGGIYECTNPASTTAGAQTWSFVGGNMQNGEIYNVAYDSQFDIIFGGAQDNGTPSQNATGSTSSYHDESGGDGGATAADSFTRSGANQSVRYFFGNVRKVYDGPNSRVAGDHDANILPQAGLAGLTNAAANDLFAGTVVNAIAPTAAQITAGQSTRVLAFGGANGATPGALYESSNAGSAGESSAVVNGNTVYFVNDTWTQVSVGAGFGQAGAVAYGGRSGGVDNPDLLYVTSGSQVFLRSTAGGTLNATAAQPAGAGTLVSIAVDPNNWNRVFVTDGSRIYMSTNAGAAWTNITGNVNIPAGGSSRSSPTLAAISGSGGDTAVMFAFTNGVQRMLVSNPGVWSRYGASLPNAVNGGLVYSQADDVLVSATYGRGFWEVASASNSVFNTSALQITGDTDFAGEDDTVRLVLDANNPLLLDVFLNGALSQFDFSAIQQINVDGLGGRDTLIVDSSNGLISVPNGIRYDGGSGSDALQLLQTGGPQRQSDNYTVGPDNGQGISTIVGGGTAGTQVVSFENLEPVLDTVSAATLNVNATAGDNAINYRTGSLVTTGLVSVDAQETIEFANKAALVINALAGADTIGINNAQTPTGLLSITVNGGDPGTGDALTVTGAGAAVSVNTATSTIAGATGASGAITMSYSGIESLALTSGVTDLAFTTTAASDQLTVTPGATGTANSGTLASSGAVPTITFANSGTLTADLAGGSDTVAVIGTASADTFAVSGAAVAITGRNAVNYSHVESVSVAGGTGNDTFNVTPSAVAVFVDGGDPIGTLPGDLLNIVAGGQSVTYNAGAHTDEGSFDVGSNASVSFDNIESFGITGSGPATVNGTNAADAITVIARDASTYAAADGVRDFTVSVNNGPQLLFIDVASLAINALGGSDQVTLVAPAPNNAVWDVDVTIDGGPPAVDGDQLVVQTPGAGAETVIYTPGAADGGTVNLASLSSLVVFTSFESLGYDGQNDNDTLSVVGTAGDDRIVHTPGATDQSGTFAVNGLLAISYQNLGALATVRADGSGGNDTLIVNGTAANDAFSVDAAGTVSLNSRRPIFTTSIETLTLEGLAGDDLFTLATAISASAYGTMNFNGGAQASATGDRVSLVGTAGNDTIVISGQSVSLGGNTVQCSGIEDIRLDALAGSNAIVYNGVAGVTENITVSSSGVAGGGQISVPGVTLVDFSNVQTIDVNGNLPSPTETDTLAFSGTNAPDVFDINLAAQGTDADPILRLRSAPGASPLLTLRNYTNFNTLRVNGLDGADTFNVYTSDAGPVDRNLYIDGGAPTAKKKSTDNLNVFYVMPRPRITSSTATQDPTSGLVDLTYTHRHFLVQYADMEQVVVAKSP